MDISTLAVALGYTKKQIEQAKREGFRVQIEQDRSILETTGEEKIFYFLPKNPQKTKDGYDEFVYTNNDWEQVGVTDVDLSSYGAALSIENGILSLLNANGDILNSVDVSGRDYNALQNRPVVTGRDGSTDVNTVLEGYLNFSSDGFAVSTYQSRDKWIDIGLSPSVPNCWTANYPVERYDFNNITGTYARAGVFIIQYQNAENKPETINDIVGSCFIIQLVSPDINANMIRYIVGTDANGQIVTYMQTAQLERINAFNYEVLYQLDWKKIGEKGDTGATGADGYSPTATVTQTQNGATVSITDKNGTTTANISNGANGDDYILTAQDKSDVADLVLAELPTTVQDNSLSKDKLVLGTLGFVTPEMFGAVGDGVTDDSTAIQNAFNYLKTHNLTLKLNGNYKINNQISVTNLHDRVIDFGSSEITIRSSEYPDIFKVIEFKNCQHLTLLNGNFYSPRNQYAVAQGTHTRYGNPSDTEDTAGNGKCSNVHCFTFYGCDYITLSNISFDGFRFDIATNIINSVKEDDGVTLKINRDFTIENIKSVNTSTSIDLLYLERAQIKGCSIKMAECLGLGDHGIYVAHDCHDIHISKLYYESDGYCGSAIQFWNNIENENYVEDINAGDYVDGTVSDSIFYCPMIYTGRYSRCEFDNITFNNVKYKWETGEAKVIALDRHAKLVVSDSRFNDGEKLLSTQKYNSVTTNGSFTNVRFENCQINNFTNSVLNFSANSLTSEVAECTDNTVECFNCEFNNLQKCAATNSHANSFMKFYNCKFSLLDAGANSTNYLSKVVYTNSKNEFHNCHADYIGSLTTNSYVIYNGSNSGTYREGVNPATAPTLFTFCYFTGFGGGMANNQSYTAVATYINGTDGNDYILTNQDKADIANIVLGLLPTTQGVQYGNQSN